MEFNVGLFLHSYTGLLMFSVQKNSERLKFNRQIKSTSHELAIPQYNTNGSTRAKAKIYCT